MITDLKPDLISKLVLAFICVIIACCYFPALQSDFINWDDPVHLTENPAVRSLDVTNIQRIFSSTVNETYIPLTILSFAVEHHFFGYRPFVYHLNNVLLHLGTVVLIYLLVLQLEYSVVTASLAALIFGIHPMHVESVAWVTQRKDVLYSLFYVWALFSYVRYIRTRRPSYYVWALVCGSLSVLAKAMALSFPLVLLLFDWFLKRPWNIRLWIEKIPFALTVFPIAWITFMLNTRKVDNGLIEGSLIWFWSLAFYISKFLFPFDLLLIYQLPDPVSLNNPAFLLPVLLVLTIVLALIRRRTNRLLLFAFGFFFLSIFFLLRTFDVTKNLGSSIVADRFMYLPSLGLCLFLGKAIEDSAKNPKNRSLYLSVICIIFVFLAVKTHAQTRLWQNSVTFWEYTEQHSEPFDLLYLNKANAHLEQKNYALAWADYNRAIDINPGSFKAYYSRGCMFDELKQYASAVDDFTSAIHLRPNYTSAYNNRGAIYLDMGKHELALNDFDKVISLEPEKSAPYVHKAMALYKLDRFDEAHRALEKALTIDPSHGQAKALLQALIQKSSQP